MEPYIPSDYGNARLKFTCTGVPRVMGTSLGIFCDGGAPADVAEFISDTFVDLVIQDGARLGNSWNFVGVDFYYTLSPGNVILYEHVASVAGTQGSPNCPPNCSLLVQKRTLFTGRDHRGRGFYPAGMLVESEVSDAGFIASGVMDGMTADFQAWRDAFDPSAYTPVLLHQFGTYVNSDGETVTVESSLPTPISALVPQSLIATQRRRLR